MQMHMGLKGANISNPPRGERSFEAFLSEQEIKALSLKFEETTGKRRLSCMAKR